jgi:Glycosyl hydrolases family 2, TIM barrel domain/Glycosyl hydrolases family 2, sugar binding domain/Glycosyl hydrolases family 2/Beta galactosidase small chain
MKFRPFFLLLLLAVASISLFGSPTENIYLSGHGSDDTIPWDFYCTGGRNSGVWTQIAVPSCWEQQGFGTYEYGVESRGTERMPVRPPPPEERGLYRREFTVPAAWRGRVVRIVFEGAMTDTEVKVNGVLAGPVHQGGFYRFSHDITDKLRFDAPNLLEVAVGKRSANDSVNRAERYADYWNFGGIFRPVRLEALPPSFIDRVAVNATADGAFVADVYLGGKLPSGRKLTLQLRDAEGRAVGVPVTQSVPAGAERVNVSARVVAPATWTAETPRLYRAEFTLRAGKRVEHTVAQRFGFRTFEVRPGDGLYLNGSKVVFKGVNRHSFWADTGRTLSLERHREDIRLMKEANLNAVRMSHYPPDAEFLDLCDEAGLYVIDELGGWQRPYDTPSGRRLIGQMIARDVNHPSVLFWSNGNEGGENPENDDEFAKHDPQHRPVLHPWAASFRGMNTSHYREYAETAKFAEGPDIFMPTEFLHGLFDGGHGAGLEDYWALMGEKPHAAGGFLWCWMDEAVARTDQGGRIDANRDLGPDGMLGPRHEKEGSFFTVRDIWCPVQIPLATLPADFSGRLPVRNRYDFVNLSGVTFEWRLMEYAPPGALLFHRKLLAHGRLAGPDVAARADGELALPLPTDWRKADTLLLTAIDSQARELGTWSWRWKSGVVAIGNAAFAKADPDKAKPAKDAVEPAEPVAPPPAKVVAVTLAEAGDETLVSAGRNTVRFNRATGRLVSLERDGRRVSLGDGPRLVAYRRDKRVLVPVAAAKGLPTSFVARVEGDSAVIVATHDAGVRETRWTISPDGDVRLDYAFPGPGVVDLLGVDFDYPEEKMKSKEWFGAGPYRVWANRLKGGSLNRWDTEYNDNIPGFTWTFPEFKGWFSRWEWMAFTTTEGRFALLNDGGQPYVGVYSPRDGKNNPVLVLPRLGLGAYQVIPAIGTKQSMPDALGPQGQPHEVTGEVRGSLIIRLLDQP